MTGSNGHGRYRLPTRHTPVVRRTRARKRGGCLRAVLVAVGLTLGAWASGQAATLAGPQHVDVEVLVFLAEMNGR